MTIDVGGCAPEMDRMLERLCNDPDRTLRNFHLTRGDGAATPEQIAAAVNGAMDQVRDGTATPHWPDGDSENLKQDVREWLAKRTNLAPDGAPTT